MNKDLLRLVRDTLDLTTTAMKKWRSKARGRAATIRRLKAEVKALKAKVGSLGRAASTLVSCCVDGQNELHGIKHGGPAKRTLRDIERCLETMAHEAADAAEGA